MSLRINTNLASLNAQKAMGNNNALLSKTLDRLSSGLRINRAADDAAGLAVSEKLRTQVKGFSQASANAQDAVNLIATAESGIDQSSSVLQRMRELSIQAASDTLVNTDRAKIQEEINQLRTELTRIAETTEFNTRTLLDGSIAMATNKVDPVGEIKQNLRVGDTSSTTVGLTDFFQQINSTFISNQPQGISFENNRLVLYTIGNPVVDVEATVDVAFEFKIVSYQTSTSAPVSISINVYNSISGFLYSVDPLDNASFNDQGGLEGFAVGHLGQTQALLDLPVYPPPYQGNNVGLNMGYVAISNALTLTDVGKSAIIQITPRRDAVTTDNSLTFQVGANEGQFLKMGVQDMRASALRLETLSILGATDQDSRLKAQNAIGAIDAALDYVNTNRSRLGAFQNRFDYMLQNLQVSRENLTASESRIRDADLAVETANLTRAQILTQATTSVLSQANSTPQSVLSLLR
jgi:flagellin